MKRYKDILVCFGVFILVTFFFGAIYAAVQQNYRQSANDPQIQMAEDAASALNNGRNIQSVVLLDNIDISKSLAAFITVYDSSGTPVMSSGYLSGEMPKLPAGVFDYTKNHGEDRFTWQPEKGVRSAVVLVRYDSGFVLAGRSLKEVEIREGNLLAQLSAAWLASIIVAGFVLYLAIFRKYNRE